MRKAIYIFSPVPLGCFLGALYFDSGTYADIFGYTGLTLSYVVAITAFLFFRKAEKAGEKTTWLALAVLLAISPHLVIVAFEIPRLFGSGHGR